MGNELGALLALFENLLPHDGHHHPSVGHVCIRGQDPTTASAAGTSSTVVLEVTVAVEEGGVRLLRCILKV